jgi:hypothetical protein
LYNNIAKQCLLTKGCNLNKIADSVQLQSYFDCLSEEKKSEILGMAEALAFVQNESNAVEGSFVVDELVSYGGGRNRKER